MILLNTNRSMRLEPGARTVIRLVVALAAFLAALYPVFGLAFGALTTGTISSLPFVVMAVAVAVGLLFIVARSRSLEQLWTFVAAVYALIFALWILLDLLPQMLGLTAVVRAATGLFHSLARAVVVYVGAYLLVYEGWYDRLKRAVAG